MFRRKNEILQLVIKLGQFADFS